VGHGGLLILVELVERLARRSDDAADVVLLQYVEELPCATVAED
jgi:DNA-directed RNA polymerase specialized sigma24 family protein